MDDRTPDWIYEGAEVAVYDARGRHVRLTKVDRLTKTQIVLANGSRYRRDDMRREIGADVWTARKLVPADDDRVRRALAHREMSSLVGALDKLLRVRAVDATPVDLLGTLDEAAERIETARAAVEKLTKED